MANETFKKDGVYLSNFVAVAISFFVLVLAFAAGFFARSYFATTSTSTTTNQKQTPKTAKPADTEDLLKFLGNAVDQNKIRTCLNSGKYDNRINEEIKIGDSLGVGGTPGFFVNNKAFGGAYNYTAMQPYVDYFLGKPEGKAPEQTNITAQQIKEAFQKSLIKFGDVNRKVIFLEFSDPSCPFCSIVSGKNSELNARAGKDYRLVKDGGTYVAPVEEMRKLVESGEASYAMFFRNGHNNGLKAMKILYCAYEQGKFWQAHDMFMSNEGYKLINGE